jgi:hypothetical protein
VKKFVHHGILSIFPTKIPKIAEKLVIFDTFAIFKISLKMVKMVTLTIFSARPIFCGPKAKIEMASLPGFGRT